MELAYEKLVKTSNRHLCRCSFGDCQLLNCSLVATIVLQAKVCVIKTCNKTTLLPDDFLHSRKSFLLADKTCYKMLHAPLRERHASETNKIVKS
jgi:hypothetical protein